MPCDAMLCGDKWFLLSLLLHSYIRSIWCYSNVVRLIVQVRHCIGTLCRYVYRSVQFRYSIIVRTLH
jgi:hypothetical protein